MAMYQGLTKWIPSGRGDGRKFRHYSWGEERYFEPFFKDEIDYWHGLSQNSVDLHNGHDAEWAEWHPPKKMKKIKMYRAVFIGPDGEYVSDSTWGSKKTFSCTILHLDSGPPVIWQETEIEVPDDGK